ncbi:ABC transporter substrate-binding protein [Leucobacter massiliensis]|uniref:Solute-binding protein family 5 domain-containing protein n=1 Tax=Leucobacter massiliensis TaxID=1686285 RepID=A0A2S9QNS3_9MICO|nr:ABC transporter substrate-binding protein [Leucobacter massiliensis]PRI11245.1 hypothetical protein B4915_10390 [Leucobacter massiliensis]
MSFATSRRGRRAFAAVSAGAAAALLLAGCGSDPGGSGGGSGEQILTFGLSAEPATPITGVQQGGAVNQLLTMVHRGLMSYDESGAVVPGVAESVETPDDTSYVFTLREGLTFHDGTPLTADNVKNSLEYYRDPANAPQIASGIADIESIQAEGDTVTITLSQPNTAFLQYLALPFAAIVPDSSLNPDTPNWVGAGPFEMTELQDGIGVTLTKDEDYYGADEVALDGVEVKFYADGEARTNALLSGDVDMIEYVPWENFDRVAEAGFTVDAKEGPFQYVQFNVEGDSPFADPKVRQAVAYAINRDNAVTAAFQSHGAPLEGIVIPESDPAYTPGAATLWSYDPERAKELLAEAGYPDGFAATLLTTSQYTFLQDNALSVQEDLRAVGIDVTLDAPDWSTRVSQGNAGEYDIAVSGDAGLITDPSYLLNWVVGNENFNVSWGYRNEELTGLIEEGLRSTDDAEKRAIYEEITGLWAEEVPIASINTRQQAYAYSDRVEGFETMPGFLVFYSSFNIANASLG